MNKKKRTYTKRSPHWNLSKTPASTTPKTHHNPPASKDHLINFIVMGVETFTGKKCKPSDVVNIYKAMEGTE